MLLIGLGNSQEQYRFTRHNIGFRALDAFAKKYAFPDFKLDEKSHALIAEDFIEHQKIVLAKPQTSMNNSGRAVAVLYEKYQIRDLIIGASGKTEIQGRHLRDQGGLLINAGTLFEKTKSVLKPFAIHYRARELGYMIVIHDDIDLPLGRMKISVGSGSAGHKGVESIIQALHTQDFSRIRMGIQSRGGKPAHVEEFVLQRFSPEEQSLVEQAIEYALSALDSILRDGIERAMNKWN